MKIFREYKPVIILFIISIIASGSLALTQVITIQTVISNQKAREKAMILSILPGAHSYQLKNTSFGKQYFEGFSETAQSIGYAIYAQGRGFRGPIKILVGFSKDGIIFNIRIFEHKETPGLGAGITQAWFVGQFDGKKICELSLDNIQAITGATISSRAVVESVKKSVEEFLKSVEK
ncbi:hypothetical protein B9J78_02235 [bacterium Unc6]|nr:hypothetical protein [bacterium Unc6]